MTIWFTSDHHFNHSNIISYCSRPFASLSEMNERIIEEWNSRVSSSDTVYVVGDFFLGLTQDGIEIGKSLTGTKILVKGNHDRSARDYLSAGFVSVSNRLSLNLESGYSVMLRHVPLLDQDLGAHDFQIHGHHHKGPTLSGRHINVCVDLWNFRPVQEKEIVELWESRNDSKNCSV